jgi:hypothetical protein
VSRGTSYRVVWYIFVNVSDDPTVSMFSCKNKPQEIKRSDRAYKERQDKN